MSDEKRLQVTGTVPAPPERVFALLADSSRHTDLDGAGMLRGVEGGGGPVSGVGDTFVMNMNQEALGDYRMRNEIVRYEQDRAIAWAPSLYPKDALAHKIGDMDPSGHIYAWELAPSADGGTTVTHTYDWSGVTDQSALAIYPIVSAEQMGATITRIADATR